MQLLILWCVAQARQQRLPNTLMPVQAALDDGIPQPNIAFYWQLIIKGGVIVLAVLLAKLRTHGRDA